MFGISDKIKGGLKTPEDRNRTDTILLFIIVAAGISLRFFQLGQESLWLDEAASGLRAQMSWSEMFHLLITIKGNPPLHYMLLKGWVSLFGHSEFSLRFMSAVFSSLSLVLFFSIARLLFSRKVAMLSIALLALSRFHVDFAQEARCYALLGVEVLLSMYFLTRLSKRPCLGFYLGYMIAASGMLYTHYYAFFVIVAQNIYILTLCLLRKPIPWRQIACWCVGQGVLLLSYLPWAAVLWQAIHKIETVPTVLQTPGPEDILACFKAFAGGRMWAAVFFLALACLSFCAIPGKKDDTAAAKPTNRIPGKEAMYLMLLWLIVPIALPFLYSLYRAPIFSPRYALISSYPFYLLIALGIFSLHIKSVRYVLIAAVLLVSARVLLPRYFFHNNEEWRQMTAYIESKAESGQALLFHAPFCGKIGYGFYAKRTDLPVLGFPQNAESGYAVTTLNINEIPALTEQYRDIWVILSHSRDKTDLIIQKMRENCIQVEHVSFSGIEVYLLKKKQDPCITVPRNPTDG